MALNQNTHRRNMRSMQTIEELRRNQKKYNKYPTYSTINEISDYTHDIGDGLSNINNEKISSIGKTIANNSGDDLKKNLFGFAKDKISSFVNKDKLPNASIGSAVSNVVNNADDTLNVINNSSNITDAANGLSNLANTTNNIANVADTAGDVAKVADTASKASQASSAISKVGNSNPVLSTATGALQVGGDLAKGNYLDAGLNAAATAANFIPVYGQAVAAAIKIGQKIKQMFDKKKQESMQRSQQAAEQTTQSSLEELNDTKNEIAQKQAQQQQAIDNGFESETPMTKPSMANITNEFKPVQPIAKPTEAPIPPITPVQTTEPVQEENPLGTIADVISDVVPQGESQTTDNSGQKQSILDSLKSKVFSKDEGQMTGGAADASKVLDMFEDPTVFSDYNKLAREQEQKQGTAPFKNFKYGLKSGYRGDVTSDMNGSVAYDYRSPATLENKNRKVADMINKEIEARRQPTIQEQTAQQPIKIGQDVQFTPEQQARHNEAMAAQGASNQSEALSPLPTATPTASPSRTNFDPSQFEIIEPDGTMHPAQQTQQVVQGQVSTTQPAQPLQPTQAQQQPSPSVMYKTPEGIKQRIANRLARAQQGYNENSTNGFKLDNVTAQEYQAPVRDENGVVNNEAIKKDIWNRIGEFAGTGKRVLSNPLAQGAIAGLLYKATGGDSGDSLRFGVDWANEKAKSDFYQKQIDPNASSNVFGGRYTAEDWKAKENIENAKAQQQYSQALLEERKRENDLRIQEALQKQKEKNNTVATKQEEDRMKKAKIKYELEVKALDDLTLTPERYAEIKRQLTQEYLKEIGY
jgi:hypothetical protein